MVDVDPRVGVVVVEVEVVEHRRRLTLDREHPAVCQLLFQLGDVDVDPAGQHVAVADQGVVLGPDDGCLLAGEPAADDVEFGVHQRPHGRAYQRRWCAQGPVL